MNSIITRSLAAAACTVTLAITAGSPAAESFIDTFEHGGGTNCWRGESSWTNVDTPVDFIMGEGHNTYIRGIAVNNSGSQAGITTEKPEVSGNWIDAQATEVFADVRVGNFTPSVLNFRVRRGAAVNGWYYALPIDELSADEWTSFSAPIDPNWTNGQALDNGWRPESEIVPSWQSTMQDHFQFSVRAGHGLTGMVTHFDNIGINFEKSPCRADIDESGVVDVEDLLQLLAAWNSCDCCRQDVNRDHVVDVNDLLELLADWGACTE